MRLHIDIKPKRVIIPNPCTLGMNMDRQLAGINAIYRVAPKAYMSFGSDGKIHWSAQTDDKNIYVYNVEYHKRGKYKNDKHFVVNVYTFSKEILRTFGISVEQKYYNFKLYKTDKYGKKIYL